MDLTVTIPNNHAQRVVDAFDRVRLHDTGESMGEAVSALGATPSTQELEDAVSTWLEGHIKDKLLDRVLNYEGNQAGLAARDSAADLFT